MSRLFSRNQVLRERAQTFFNNDVRLSQDKLKAQNFRGATDSAEDARAVAESNRELFSEAEYQSMVAQVNQQEKAIKTDQQAFATTEEIKANRDMVKNDAQRREESRMQRTRDVNRLMGEARHSYSEQQYEQAAETLQHLLVLDPQNDAARLFLDITKDRINFRRAEDFKRRQSSELVQQSIMSSEELIPYSQLLIYPEDWPELSRRRQGEQNSSEKAVNIKVRERLDQNLSDLSADQQPFDKVIEYLRNASNTNIFVNWATLQGAGVDKNTPISVNLHDVPFSKALTTVLSAVGPQASLGYAIDEGVITISTKDDLQSDKYKVTRIYDIRDMLVQPDDNVKPPSFNLQQITQNGVTQGGQSGGGQGALGGGGGGLFNQTSTTDQPKSRDDIVKEIITAITSTVAPDSWRDQGGTIGAVRELNGQLIVTQISDNQSAVFNLLAQLRETRALQIAIEARFLLVDNNFLDDFGFSWGLTLPAGQLGTNVGTVTVNNNSAAQAVPQSTGVPSSLVGILGATATSATGTSTSNALDISGQILDNYQLNLLLRATQADRRTTTVDSPRVTLFNGQRGYIAVTSQQNFVASFTTNVAAGGINGNAVVANTPNVATLTTGVVLFVEATVSSDRRYVVMKLSPTLSTLDGIDSFAVSSNGGTTTVAASTRGGGLSSIAAHRFIPPSTPWFRYRTAARC